MGYLILKYAITAALIVAASEIAKRSDKFGAIILSLPLMTIITLFWLYMENQSTDKIANHAWYTFWYVIPTLPVFLLFPILLHNFGFGWAIVFFIVGSTISFSACGLFLRKIGIELF